MLLLQALLLLYVARTIMFVTLNDIMVASTVGIVLAIANVVDVAQCYSTPSMSSSVRSHFGVVTVIDIVLVAQVMHRCYLIQKKTSSPRDVVRL